MYLKVRPEPCIHTMYDRMHGFSARSTMYRLYIHTQGWPGPYIHTQPDRILGNFLAKNTVYTPYIYIYGSGQPYTYAFMVLAYLVHVDNAYCLSGGGKGRQRRGGLLMKERSVLDKTESFGTERFTGQRLAVMNGLKEGRKYLSANKELMTQRYVHVRVCVRVCACGGGGRGAGGGGFMCMYVVRAYVHACVCTRLTALNRQH